MEGAQERESVGKFERTTQGQLQFFVKFCKEHPELLRAKSQKNDPQFLRNLWAEVADTLNAMRGPTRSADKWKVTLIHWRHQLRSRARKRKEQESIESNSQTNETTVEPLTADVSSSEQQPSDGFVVARPVRRIPKNFESQAKRKHVSEDNRTRLSSDKFESPNMHKNIIDNIAQTWASQYNEMEARQRVIARKIISDVLFQGCVGGLTIHHTKQIENIFSSQRTPSTDIGGQQEQEAVNVVPKILHTNTRKLPTIFKSGLSCSNNSDTNMIATPTHNTESIYFAEDSSNDMEESLLDEM